jgi:hypothetical protein
LLRGVYLAWQTPTGIAFLLSKKILKETCLSLA